MGSTDVAIGMAAGQTWLRVPETFRIESTDGSPTASAPKTSSSTIIGRLGADGATYRALEFAARRRGAAMHERLTLTHMAVEAGAKTGLVASDEVTRAFLAAQGREADWRALAPDPAPPTSARCRSSPTSSYRPRGAAHGR